MEMILCRFRRERQGDGDLILRNGDVCQVWRLDPEVRHVYGANCRSSYGITNDLSLYVEDLFVGFTVHCQVAGQLKMNRLPVSIARR